jgi:hypothetical protein
MKTKSSFKKGDRVISRDWGPGKVEDDSGAVFGEYGVRFKKGLFYVYEEEIRLPSPKKADRPT